MCQRLDGATWQKLYISQLIYLEHSQNHGIADVVVLILLSSSSFPPTLALPSGRRACLWRIRENLTPLVHGILFVCIKKYELVPGTVRDAVLSRTLGSGPTVVMQLLNDLCR